MSPLMRFIILLAKIFVAVLLGIIAILAFVLALIQFGSLDFHPILEAGEPIITEICIAVSRLCGL